VFGAELNCLYEFTAGDEQKLKILDGGGCNNNKRRVGFFFSHCCTALIPVSPFEIWSSPGAMIILITKQSSSIDVGGLLYTLFFIIIYSNQAGVVEAYFATTT